MTADDEYVLDTPTVRAFVASVRAAIGGAASPADACDAIRPAFATLLADREWLPPQYARGAPQSGIGGGTGQWPRFRPGRRAPGLFVPVVPPRAPAPGHHHP